MKYFVTLYVSCESGQRIGQIMEKVDYVLANAKREIPMALFNNVLTNAISVNEPPAKHGKKVKIICGISKKVAFFCNCWKN